MRNDFNPGNVYSPNAAQMSAITHRGGPAMVIAGPGSGKTFVIAARLKFMIEEMKVDPSSILVITFTKAAAIEMQYRFLKITDSSYPGVTFGTFHSVFFNILRQLIPGKNTKPNIATNAFKREILRDILSSLYAQNIMSRDEMSESEKEIDMMIAEISRLKNLGLSGESCVPTLTSKKCFDRILESYSKALLEFERFDFDDMVIRCREELLKNPEALLMWQRRFCHILIDEYQDINTMQFETVKLLLGDLGNLFVVGDDDQSIYGFRGSDPGIMISFSKEFEEKAPSIINLSVNYRSSENIINASALLINDNLHRLKKTAISFNKENKGRVLGTKFLNKQAQMKGILKFLLNNKDDLGKIAILFRTNAQCRAMAEFLGANGIASSIESNSYETDRFFKDPGVEMCLNYFRFICGGRRREDFVKIMNLPQRYISRECLNRDVVEEADLLKFYSKNKFKTEKIRELFKEINMLSHLRPKLAVRYLIKEIGVMNLYPDSKERLNELENISENCKSAGDLLKAVDKIREENERAKDNNKRKPIGRDVVNITTFHGAKGLEYEKVWLPDLNEGIIPSRSSVTQTQIEEERRMLYVGMTRAKTTLIMSYLSGTDDNPMLPSRFLRPLKGYFD